MNTPAQPPRALTHAARLLLGLMLAIAGLPTPALADTAQTWWVSTSQDPTGDKGTSCDLPDFKGSSDTAITEALDQAAAGDTIHLCAGTWTFSDQVSITKSIAIVGEGWKQTVISGNKETRHFEIDGSAGDQVTLQGMTLKLGHAVDAHAGSVRVKGAGNVAISGIYFLNNAAEGEHGGAIMATSSGELRVTRSSFRGNFAVDGGAIELMETGNRYIENNFFFRNGATRDGGAIGTSFSGTISIRNNTFVNNCSSNGVVRATSGTTLTGNLFAATNNADAMYGCNWEAGNGAWILDFTDFEGGSLACAQEGEQFVGGGNLTTDSSCDEATLDSATVNKAEYDDLGLSAWRVDTPIPGFFFLRAGAGKDALATSDCPARDAFDQSRVGLCDIGAVEQTRTFNALNRNSVLRSADGAKEITIDVSETGYDFEAEGFARRVYVNFYAADPEAWFVSRDDLPYVDCFGPDYGCRPLTILNSTTLQLDVSGLPASMYLVEVAVWGWTGTDIDWEQPPDSSWSTLEILGTVVPTKSRWAASGDQAITASVDNIYVKNGVTAFSDESLEWGDGQSLLYVELFNSDNYYCLVGPTSEDYCSNDAVEFGDPYDITFKTPRMNTGTYTMRVGIWALHPETGWRLKSYADSTINVHGVTADKETVASGESVTFTLDNFSVDIASADAYVVFSNGTTSKTFSGTDVMKADSGQSLTITLPRGASRLLAGTYTATVMLVSPGASPDAGLIDADSVTLAVEVAEDDVDIRNEPQLPPIEPAVIFGVNTVRINAGSTAVTRLRASQDVRWLITSPNALFSIDAMGNLSFTSASTSGTHPVEISAINFYGVVTKTTVTVAVNAAPTIRFTTLPTGAVSVVGADPDGATPTLAASAKNSTVPVAIKDGFLMVTDSRFSGRLSVVVVATDSAGLTSSAETEIVVKPQPVTGLSIRSLVTPASAVNAVATGTTSISWVASPNASQYQVNIGGRATITTASTSLTLSDLLSPYVKVSVTSIGGNELTSTVSGSTQTWEPVAAGVTPLTAKSAKLGKANRAFLAQVVTLTQTAGFGTIEVTVRGAATSTMARAQFAAIRSYLTRQLAGSTVTVTPRYVKKGAGSATITLRW